MSTCGLHARDGCTSSARRPFSLHHTPSPVQSPSSEVQCDVDHDHLRVDHSKHILDTALQYCDVTTSLDLSGLYHFACYVLSCILVSSVFSSW